MVEIKGGGGTAWFFYAMYTSPDSSQRRLLWDELTTLAASIDNSWLLAGDFNDTVSIEERHSGSLDMQRRCDRFKHWIANNALIDLGYSGPKFTCMRGNTARTRQDARLDRALYNMSHENFKDFVASNWNQQWPIVSLLKEFVGKLQAWNQEASKALTTFSLGDKKASNIWQDDNLM
ncbi:hypothetical protein Cgig2_016240 [Carnegiea gigantea]|uniref:Endonuclease/exonuclease/phosphatase domain-containing protein n=1 Tax=Carnegiea gigantea TaxID=171969 RepID=A0A9Q1Q564_9CARY|nr:hypothetical protein Cgig2_016240 [Carnegiea gigantea]